MATEADLRRYVEESGRNWDQLCEALVSNWCAQFGRLLYYPPSAISAYYSSKIESYDAYACPLGGIIWLDIGEFGHVMFQVDGGAAGQATKHLQEVWGINAGKSALAYYVSKTGARPLGWSWDNAGSTLPYESSTGPGPAPEPPKEELMFVKATDGFAYIPAGWTFQLSDDGRWRALSKEESGLVGYLGYKIAEWSGADIYNHSQKAGLWEFTGAIDSGDPGVHTGYLLFGDRPKRLPGEVYMEADGR